MHVHGHGCNLFSADVNWFGSTQLRGYSNRKSWTFWCGWGFAAPSELFSQLWEKLSLRPNFIFMQTYIKHVLAGRHKRINTMVLKLDKLPAHCLFKTNNTLKLIRNRHNNVSVAYFVAFINYYQAKRNSATQRLDSSSLSNLALGDILIWAECVCPPAPMSPTEFRLSHESEVLMMCLVTL